MSIHELPARWLAADLLEYGAAGDFQVLSIHDHVINLRVDNWNHLLMIASPEVHRGPSSTGLSSMDFTYLRQRLTLNDTGRFAEDTISFDSNELICVSLSRAEQVSFSVPALVAGNDRFLLATLPAAEIELKILANSQACSILLGNTGMDDPFAAAIGYEFRRLLRALTSGNQYDFEASCHKLVGLGYGSTPTGDDLIHGALIARHYLRKCFDLDLPIPCLPTGVGTKTTLLGNHMLEMGAKGLTPEPARVFILELLAGRPVNNALETLCRMGSDTGFSIASSLFLTVVEYLKTQKTPPHSPHCRPDKTFAVHGSSK